MKTTLILVGLLLNSMIALCQNPSWTFAPNYLINSTLPNLPQPTIRPDGSPINGSDPWTYYHGEKPKYTSNMIRKPNGEIDFFLIDQFIYDKNGYAIDVLTTNETPNPFATGASEVLIVPNPANCQQYYIVSTVINPGSYEKTPYLFLLDMSVPNDYLITTTTLNPCEYKGALQIINYLYGNPPIGVNYISIDNISKGSFIPPDPVPGKRSGVFLASSKKRTDGSYKVFISNGDGLFTFTVDQTGFNFTNLIMFPNSGFNPNNVRGEMDIAELNNGNYRIAVPYLYNPFSGSNYAQSLFTAEIASNGAVVAGTEKIFNTLDYNPNGVDQSAKYRGVEFSEDGRYLYVTHTINAIEPNAFNYYDFNNPTPGLNPISLPIGLTQDDLQFSLIERGFNNRLFMANQNGLYQLANMNNPNSAIVLANGFTYTPNYEGQIPAFSSLKAYMLPDQIDGMDYSDHYTENLQCCLDSRDFDVIDFTATTNGTWTSTNPLNNGSTTATIRHELRIPAGKNITISGMTLKFAPGARLVIENGVNGAQGGKLILQNSTLTVDDGCSTDALWLGVEVWGNQNQSQGNLSNTSQGVLRVYNSKIEHARIGVLLSQRNIENSNTSGCYAESEFSIGSYNDARNGGIVQAASNSEFFNNPVGVYFRKHSSPNGANNLSSFTQVDFNWVGSLRGNTGVLQLARLDQVKGVNFKGCDFARDDSSNPSYSPQGMGIYSYYSQFYVTEKCTSIGPIGAPCQSSIPSTFTNLNYGIYTQSGSSINGYLVNESEFTDCRIGIMSYSATNSRITRNKFNVREELYQCAGISYINSTGYTITENYLQENDNPSVANGTAESYGMVITNSGVADNEVYKNTFMNLKVGGQSQRLNASESQGAHDATTGLNWTCNLFKTDIYLADLGVNGVIDKEQGNIETSSLNEARMHAARNTFSLATNTNTEHDIMVYNPSVFAYPQIQAIDYVYLDDPYQIPNDKDGSVAIQVAQFNSMNVAPSGNECPTKIKTGVLIKFQLEEIKLKITDLKSMIDDNATAQLLTAIANSGSSNTTYQSLMDVSPYLSDKVLLAYLQSNATAGHKKNVLTANSALSEVVLEAVLSSNLPNGTKNVIIAAQNNPSMMVSLLVQINESEQEYNTLYSNYKSLLLLDTTELASYSTLVNALTELGTDEAKRDLMLIALELRQAQTVNDLKDELATIENPYFMDLINLKEDLSYQLSDEKALQANGNMVSELNNIKDNSTCILTSKSAECILTRINGDPTDEDFLPLQSPSAKLLQNGNANQTEEKSKLLPVVVNMYPNPSSGQVYFDLPNEEVGTLTIQVFDLTGKEVFIQQFESTNGELVDLSNIKNGTYLVKITLGSSYTESQLLQLK